MCKPTDVVNKRKTDQTGSVINLRRRVFVLIVLCMVLWACGAGAVDFGETATPPPTELCLNPNLEIQPPDEWIDWKDGGGFFRADWSGWNEDRFDDFVNHLVANGWMITHSDDSSGFEETLRLRNYAGEYLQIMWDYARGFGSIFYFAPGSELESFIAIGDSEAPTVTKTPVVEIPWPEYDFPLPPYVPQPGTAVPTQLVQDDYSSGIEFAGCTQEDFDQFKADMERNGWAYHSEQSDGICFIYTGETDLGEYLSISWNSFTGDGTLTYGTKESIPTLED